MKSFFLLVAVPISVILAAAATPVWALESCPGVLRIVGSPELAAARGGDPMNLELNSCEVRAKLVPVPGKGRPTLELKVIGARAAALREAFEPGGQHGPALLRAELRIASAAGDLGKSAIPKGPLLDADSARMIADGHWRWHARSASLRWEGTDAPAVGMPSSACNGVSAQNLFLWFGTLDIKPGEMIARRPLIVRGGPGAFDPVPPSCFIRWSLSPGAPASLHAASGVVVVDAALENTTSPSHFSVFAQIGSRLVEGKVAVFQPELQPLVGTWTQVSERLCGNEKDQPPRKAIQELRLTADGLFRLTWEPFEARYDFSGSYRHNRNSGVIAFVVDGGNAGHGFSKDNGIVSFPNPHELVITGVDPGPMAPSDQTVCAMSFTRVP